MALVILICLQAGCSRRDDAGDAELPPDVDTAVGLAFPVGDDFTATYGNILPVNPFDEPMMVERVELLRSQNIEHLGDLVLAPEQAFYPFATAESGFPLGDEATDAASTPIPVTPKRQDGAYEPPTTQLQIGVRLGDADVGSFTGVRVTYRVGDKRVTFRYRHRLILCRAPKVTADECRERAQQEPVAGIDWGDERG